MIQDAPPVIWVDSPEDMMKFVKHVRGTKECAQDTETTGLNRHSDHILFWSASPDEKSRYCFSREMLEIFDQELTQDPNISWYYTNQTFDFCMLNNSGVRVPVGPTYCTLAMDWLSDENRMGRHGLKETAWDYLQLNMSEFKEVFKGRKRSETLQERLLRAMEEDFIKSISYASADAWATFRVFKHLKKQLENSYNLQGDPLWDYFEAVERPFTRVLYDCCRRGVMVDVGYLGELGPRIQEDMLRIERKINKAAGRELNLKSTPQLREFLFGKLKLKPVKMTSGGQSGVQQPSTDASCLQRWSDQGVEEVDWIIEYRELAKKYGTYVKGLLKWVDGDFRIHPTLTQHVAVTGRLSSVDPNLQNIPRPGSDQFGIRSAFMPKDKHIFIVADYEQLEMRLMAHYSGDENMIGVINRGWDIHTGTASLMFGHKYEDILAAVKKKKIASKDPTVVMTKLEKEMCFSRQASKNIGFGLNYGEGIAKLAKTLGVSQERAKELKEQYFQPYPSVKQFIDGVHQFIRDEYCVSTILGRLRRFPEMETLGGIPYWKLRGNQRAALAQAERQSVNSIIQGCKRVTSRVMTTHGMRTMEQLHRDVIAGDIKPLVTYSGQTSSYTVHTTGKKSVYRLSTSHGTDYITKAHRFFQYAHKDLEVVQLKDLKVGDFVVAHGATVNDDDIEVSSKEPRQTLLNADLECASKENKSIPEWIFHAPVEHRVACLRGLYDSDGSLMGDRYPQFTNTSLALVEGFQILCHSLGLFCRVAPDNNTIGKPAYRATIIPEQAEEFIETVRPIVEHKCLPLQRECRVSLPSALVKDVAELILCSDTWSATIDVTKELSNSNDGSWRKRSHICHVKKHFARHEQAHVYRMRSGSGTRSSCLKFLSRLLEHESAARSGDILNLIDLCNHHWAQVRSIDFEGVEPTMDIEIFDDDHSYVSGGLLQHNSAADVAKKAMILCNEDVCLQDLGCELLLQVHDELVFECPEETAVEAMPIIKDLMEHPFTEDLSVPLNIDSGMGYSWSEAKA